MSGGSFDYLCHKEADDFVAWIPDSIREMVDALAAYDTPEAKAASKHTARVVLQLEAWQRLMDEHLKMLRPIWKAVEWHHSSDYSKDAVHEALAAYALGESEGG